MAYTFKHGDRPIDGYTIQRAVGRGGFGEVYYAISDGGREVALKYLRDNPQVELRGVSHCINLKSPHLVSIFDVKTTTDGEYAIIMEYCSGPSLRDLLIAEPNGFGSQKAAFFTREIAKGLAYLHDRGIVHRDLKPGNIFYDDGYVKIGDYGLSKFISVSRHSGQTASVGTVHYMAPEIGSGNYSRGVDIYALGVMLYEMLLGKVPFEGSSMAEVLMKHLTAQPEVDHLPRPFGQVIRKAMAKDPLDRYQTVDEMVEALLEVEAVRESLAGFSTKSLEGAVRRGVPGSADSPIPSPNRIPIYGRKLPPPVRGDAAYPSRLAKKVDRISRKMKAKMAKLAGRPIPQHPPPMPGVARETGAGLPAPPFVLADRRKRILLSALLSVGLAVGLGVLIGNAQGEEAGISAALLVFAMSGGIILARSAVRWFGVQYGPKWSQRLVQLCCCTPLLAIGVAPMLGRPGLSEEGAALWLGLLALAVFGNWEKTIDKASTGEMSFGGVLWTALCALICTAIAGGILDADVEDIIFVGAGIAGAVSLINQASNWWLPARATSAVAHPDRAAGAAEPLGGSPLDLEVRAETQPETPPAGLAYGDPNSAPSPSDDLHSHQRWGITRAFWGLVSFVLMGGAIVTFLIPLIAENMPHGDVTGAIVGCTACASFMIFALRKTTPLKRHGFWRETLRPFLISATMFGIGGMITGIAREWNYVSKYGSRLHDDSKVALVFGLVMCSLMFLGLTLFTGRKPRAPRPFLQDTDSDHEPKTPPDVSAALRPHHGIAVLVLGILSLVTWFFPFGIIAWVMGNNDLAAMRAGRMDPTGMGLTSAGRVCGMINIIVTCIAVVGGLFVAAACALLGIR